MVYIALNSFTDDDGQCSPSNAAIADRAGFGVRATRYALDALERVGRVKRLRQTSMRTTLYQVDKPVCGISCHEQLPEMVVKPVEVMNVAPTANDMAPTAEHYAVPAMVAVVVQKKEIVQVPKREVVHKRESVLHIPKIIWNRKTLQLEYDDKARLTFDLAYSGADFDTYIGNVRGWIIRTGKVRQNYWKSLCTFVEHDRQKQNTMPLSGYAPPSTPFTDEERKDKKKALYDGFGDEPGDDSINLIDGRS